jgi:hypothetical protein
MDVSVACNKLKQQWFYIDRFCAVVIELPSFENTDTAFSDYRIVKLVSNFNFEIDNHKTNSLRLGQSELCRFMDGLQDGSFLRDDDRRHIIGDTSQTFKSDCLCCSELSTKITFDYVCFAGTGKICEFTAACETKTNEILLKRSTIEKLICRKPEIEQWFFENIPNVLPFKGPFWYSLPCLSCLAFDS